MSSIFSLLMLDTYEGAIVVVHPILMGSGNCEALSPSLSPTII